MRRKRGWGLGVIALSASIAGCASVPIPASTTTTVPPKGAGYEVCVLEGSRDDRFTMNGVADFSFATWHQVISSVVVKRPDGLLVIDPAFSSTLKKDLDRSPWWFGLVSGSADGKKPLVTLLTDAGLSADQVKWAAVTHTHWDHLGAAGELPQAKVLLSQTEADFARALTGDYSHGVLVEMVTRAKDRFAPFTLDGPPLLGFDASKDLFGDGSVIALAMPGHTPGSVGYLVTDTSRARWLFIGDAAWMLRGVQEPVQRAAIPRSIVDGDVTQVGITLGRIHALLSQHPEIHIVPAHDALGYEGLKACGAK